MFFNQDILYRSGPLALVWMAGNDAFKTKKGRSRKHYVSCLKADIRSQCDQLRSLFPQMGTANGIPIKKMGVLAKGVGVIFFLKLEDFAREVTQALLASKRPSHLTLDIIPPKRGTKKLVALQLPQNEDDEGLQTIEEDYVALYGFEQPLEDHEGFPTPRRRDLSSISPRRSDDRFDRIEATPIREVHAEQRSARKRKRGEQEEEDDILRRLQETADNADPRAHLLIEEDPAFLRPDAMPEDRDLEFGDGMALLNGMDDMGGAFGGQDPLAPADAEHGIASPALATVCEDQTTRMGPPTNIEDDSRSRAQETPAGAEPERGNGRKRRTLGREPDETVMELPEIDNEVRVRRKLRPARRRLQVDKATAIPVPDIYDGIERNKAATNYDTLHRRLDETRAPPKSMWKILSKRAPMTMIHSSGRPHGVTLTEMWEDNIKALKARPPRAEVQRSGEPNASRSMAENVMSVISGAAGRSVEGTGVGRLGDEDVTIRPGAPAIEGDASTRDPVEVIQGPSPPMIHAAQEMDPAYDDGFGFGAQHPPAPADEYQGEMAPLEDPFPMPEQPPRKSKSKDDDQTALAKKLDGGKTFEELYPPEKCGKGKAARAFLQMLRMQSKKTICLKQEECFGDIRVEKLSPPQ